ncbi:YtxH domain-containing protein [Alteribacter natronophilus]|uniref:YtxH domain-containing protein n=1 Tax=Alteribacter natronophilus TaxID=2583810 RepID=UPI00110F18F9|nr:YtxH domain-containing protein [Alteribacter natronophilus]TMW71134.1 YtxH domain-containing protein [Alteribacter natronophilus]
MGGEFKAGIAVTGFITGSVIGGIAAVLTARRPGDDVRRELYVKYAEKRKRLEDLRDEIRLESARIEDEYLEARAKIEAQLEEIDKLAVQAAHENDQKA